MCGIIGIYSYKKNVTAEEAYVKRCLKTMRHRGPDSDGVWHNDANYITGFVRLAIRDLSEHGNQPMLSACGNYCITFNGEIYNAEKFRQPLINKGVEFKSTSDTEILLYSIIHFGIKEVLTSFDGIFAFLFFDKRKNELLAVRDRVGIKPLYAGFDNNDGIIFSSQYDHIINYNSIQDQPLDPAAIGAYLQLGYVPDNSGAVKRTLLVPHGHYAIVNSYGYTLEKYFSFRSSFNKAHQPLSENIFSNAITGQLVSDVPVGTYLSGGVDSSLVTWWANKAQPVEAFTIGTDDEFTNEGEMAVAFAARNNIKHHLQQITENDLFDLIKDNFISHSEPFADFSSIPSLLLSKIAGASYKVILSGDGPDELFWGYDRNIKYQQRAGKFFGPSWKQFAELAYSKVSGQKTLVDKRMLKSKNFFDFYYQSLFLYGSNILPDIYKPECATPFFLQDIKNEYREKDEETEFMYIMRDMEMNINLQRILLKVDRAGMYNSVEVRVPYLSNEIMDLAMLHDWKPFVEHGKGKYFLKHLLAEKMDADFAFKQKKGFLIPMSDWIRQSLQKDVSEQLWNMPGELQVLFNSKAIKNMLDIHIVQGKDLSNIIWAVYALINWYKVHRKNNSLAV